MKINNFIKDDNFIENCLFSLFLLLPIFFLIGNFTVNLIYILVSIIFALGLLTKKIKINFKDQLFYLLVFLFLTFIINLFFSNDIKLTLPRIIKFITIILFVLSFKYLLKFLNKEKFSKIYKFWTIIFFIVIIDLIFEIISGRNIIGNKSLLPGRLSGFTGDEMVIGNYFSAFALIAISSIHLKYKNLKFDLFFIVLIIFLSFLIGERSNFLKTLLMISFFIFFIQELKLRYILVFFVTLIMFLNLLILSNQNYKTRYFSQLKNFLSSEGINYYLNETQYGAHFKISKEIFLNYPIFGVGIKNFRIESFKKKYEGILSKHLNAYKIDDDYGLSADKPTFGKWTGGSTHPHQLHYEFLSETGLFGYLSFLIFILISLRLSIKSFLKEKNLFQLSGILFVTVSLIPIIPSGSFFSTFTSGLFWINYALMMSYINFNTKF